MPFGAETMENDPCTAETTRNYNAGTGTRRTTSAQAKEQNRQALTFLPDNRENPVLTYYFLKMGECQEVLGGGPAPPSKL